MATGVRRTITILGVTALVAGTPGVAAAKAKTVLDKHGSGISSTRRFAVADHWHLVWSFDCSSFGSKGNFQIYISHPNGNPSLYDNGPNKLARYGSGREYEPRGGRYYLEVNSECSWHVKVKSPT